MKSTQDLNFLFIVESSRIADIEDWGRFRGDRPGWTNIYQPEAAAVGCYFILNGQIDGHGWVNYSTAPTNPSLIS